MEESFARVLTQNCRKIKRIVVDQSGNDECFRLFLGLPELEVLVINSLNNADVSGKGLEGVVNYSLKELTLGAMCKIDRAGLFGIARACPNLEVFAVTYIKNCTVEDGPKLHALLPKLRHAAVVGEAKILTLGDPSMRSEFVRRHSR
jgi:hypothetical protein